MTILFTLSVLITNLLRRNRRRNIFFSFRKCLTRDLPSNKPTNYLHDYGDFTASILHSYHHTGYFLKAFKTFWPFDTITKRTESPSWVHTIENLLFEGQQESTLFWSLYLQFSISALLISSQKSNMSLRCCESHVRSQTEAHKIENFH